MKLVKVLIILILVCFTFSMVEELQSSKRKKLNRKLSVKRDGNKVKNDKELIEEEDEDEKENTIESNDTKEMNAIMGSTEDLKLDDTVVIKEMFDENEKSKKILLIAHGIGDSCKNMSSWEDLFKNKRFGYNVVKCIEYGAGLSGFLGTLENKAKKFCKKMKKDKEIFNHDVDFIGISMGGLIGRYIIQECEFGGKVKKFISYGSPQSGVQLVPNCDVGECSFLHFLSSNLVYKKITQYTFTPSNFFRVIGKEDSYLKYALFLPKINNQIDHKKKDIYKKRFSSLEKLVLVQFEKDQLVQPSISSLFGYLDSKNNLVDMRNTDEYKNDVIGLKTLDQAKKIVEIVVKGQNHLKLGDDSNERSKNFMRIFGELN